MIRIEHAALAALALSLSVLGGCASRTPAAGGASVRAIMASQTLPAQAPRAAAADGAAAVAAYANYQRSFVTPVAPGDNPVFGTK